MVLPTSQTSRKFVPPLSAARKGHWFVLMSNGMIITPTSR
jgi:hypothetical protein